MPAHLRLSGRTLRPVSRQGPPVYHQQPQSEIQRRQRPRGPSAPTPTWLNLSTMPRQVEHARRRRSAAPRAEGSIHKAMQRAAASGARPGHSTRRMARARGSRQDGAGPGSAGRAQRAHRRPSPRSNRPASSIRISASAPRRLQAHALIGGGEGAEGRGPISARHAPDQLEPPACAETGVGGVAGSRVRE